MSMLASDVQSIELPEKSMGGNVMIENQNPGNVTHGIGGALAQSGEDFITSVGDEAGVAPPEAIDLTSSQTVEDRIKRLEETTDLEFIRREVRFIPAIVNFWRFFRFSDRENARSRASLTALLWRLFSPGTAAAAGGFLVLVLTAAQAMLIYQQNQKLDQQTYLAEASRRGVLTAEFASLAEKIGGERSARVAKQEVLPWKKFKVDAVHFRLEDPTAARLSAFTRSAKPYRYLDLDADRSEDDNAGKATGPSWVAHLHAHLFYDPNTPKLNAVPLSPERGQALSFLSTTNVDLSEASSWGLDFSHADLRNVQLVGTRARTVKLLNADMTGATLLAVDLEASDLRGVVLRNACWQEGDMSLAKLKGADLRGASLNDVALPINPELIGVKIDEKTNLDGSFSFIPKWIDSAKTSLAPELRPHLDRYIVSKIERTFTKHDFDGRALTPEIRTVYVLRLKTRMDLPASCEFLPGA
jgi:hypothetical protein